MNALYIIVILMTIFVTISEKMNVQNEILREQQFNAKQMGQKETEEFLPKLKYSLEILDRFYDDNYVKIHDNYLHEGLFLYFDFKEKKYKFFEENGTNLNINSFLNGFDISNFNNTISNSNKIEDIGAIIPDLENIQFFLEDLIYNGFPMDSLLYKTIVDANGKKSLMSPILYISKTLLLSTSIGTSVPYFDLKAILPEFDIINNKIKGKIYSVDTITSVNKKIKKAKQNLNYLISTITPKQTIKLSETVIESNIIAAKGNSMFLEESGDKILINLPGDSSIGFNTSGQASFSPLHARVAFSDPILPTDTVYAPNITSDYSMPPKLLNVFDKLTQDLIPGLHISGSGTFNSTFNYGRIQSNGFTDSIVLDWRKGIISESGTTLRHRPYLDYEAHIYNNFNSFNGYLLSSVGNNKDNWVDSSGYGSIMFLDASTALDTNSSWFFCELNQFCGIEYNLSTPKIEMKITKTAEIFQKVFPGIPLKKERLKSNNGTTINEKDFYFLTSFLNPFEKIKKYRDIDLTAPVENQEEQLEDYFFGSNLYIDVSSLGLYGSLMFKDPASLNGNVVFALAFGIDYPYTLFGKEDKDDICKQYWWNGDFSSGTSQVVDDEVCQEIIKFPFISEKIFITRE